MMKKLVSIWTIVIAVAVLLVVVTTVSLAVWRQNDHDSLHVRTPIADEDTSLKYQMYVPVEMLTTVDDKTGESVPVLSSISQTAYRRLAGTFSVTNDQYSYTLTTASDASKIVGFALVGWFGGIAYDACYVPEEITVTVDGNPVKKPVVKVLADTDFIDYSFRGENTVITNIVISKNVNEIDSGFFFGMPYLTSVKILGTESDSTIFLRSRCFGCCVRLRTPESERTIMADNAYDGSGTLAD